MGGEELVVAGWILDEPLGTGGFGEVWKAHRRHLDHHRALKLMRIVSDTAFKSWRHEIARLEALSHPNIVRFYDADIVAEGPYRNHAWIATELCERSLAGELRRRPAPVLTETECEQLLDEMLGALSAARSGGCVHRDVKPANILLHASGAWKLADFGTARLVPPGASHAATQVIGTLPYMSPDAHRGRQDHAADLYALGVTIHESMSGRRLHPRPGGMTDSEYVRFLLDTPPTIDPALPQRWKTIVEALIGRHGSPDAAELAEWVHAPFGSAPPVSAAGVAGVGTAPTERAGPAAGPPAAVTSTTLAGQAPASTRNRPLAMTLALALAAAAVVVVALAFLLRDDGGGDGNGGDDDAAGRGETSTTADESGATTPSQPDTDVVGQVRPDPAPPADRSWPADTLDDETLIAGEGRAAAQGDTLTAHYVGELADGTVFDQSWDGEPFAFTLGQGSVIAGWEQGLVGARAGERRRLIVGSDLAYGDEGTPDGSVPPGAVLVFEIDILDVRPA